jgi:hypothetical protein
MALTKEQAAAYVARMVAQTIVEDADRMDWMRYHDMGHSASSRFQREDEETVAWAVADMVVELKKRGRATP